MEGCGGDPSPSRPSPAVCGPVTDGSGACYECAVCMEAPTQPVVTRCGHLYCWACMFKWLQLGHRTCPVCKSAVDSQGGVTPLYGRGNDCAKPRMLPCGTMLPPPPRPARPEGVGAGGGSHGGSALGGGREGRPPSFFPSLATLAFGSSIPLATPALDKYSHRIAQGVSLLGWAAVAVILLA